MENFFAIGLLASALVTQATSSAAIDESGMCLVTKLKVAAKYGACRLGEESKAARAGYLPDFFRCAEQFSSKWQAAEAKADGLCPPDADAGRVDERIVTHTEALAELLAGREPGQVDNLDGTITDQRTGLLWEKKVGFDITFASIVDCATETGSCANPHDANNGYTWTAGAPGLGGSYDGTVVTIFLDQLNNRCSSDVTLSCASNTDCSVPGGPCGFAGHRDWRLPSQAELAGIVDYSQLYPAVSAAFNTVYCAPTCTDIRDPKCSCTGRSTYWSANTARFSSDLAWFVGFDEGLASKGDKTYYGFARAVRGRS